MKLQINIMHNGCQIGSWEVPREWPFNLMDRIVVNGKPFDIISFRENTIHVWESAETIEQESFWKKAL